MLAYMHANKTHSDLVAKKPHDQLDPTLFHYIHVLNRLWFVSLTQE